MTDYDIHSCGYYCDRPACIKAQRDELRQKLFSDQAVKTYSGGKSNYTEPDEALMKRVMDGIPDMPIKVQDEREANYKSFAQSARVNGIPEAYTPAKGGLLPEPQPVAYINGENRSLEWAKPTQWETPTVVVMDKIPLFTVPPQREKVYCGCGDEIVADDGARCGTCLSVKYKEREWVGLTDLERYMCDSREFEDDRRKYAEAIEAKLKEKNSG